MKQEIQTTQQRLLALFQYYWIEKRSLVIGVLTVVFVTALSVFGQSNWYKSSLLESSNPFNGTIFPIEKSPNYLTWKGSVKTNFFSEIAQADLIKLPDYGSAVAGGDTDDVKNAQLTFPVVYLGDYEGTFKENVGSHLAVDIRVPVGTPVLSVANGVVVKVNSTDSGFGHHICVRHKSVPDYKNKSTKTNLISCYNHMDKLMVEEGQFVFKGDQIGTSGNTGTSTTPHLHFQIDREEAPWHPWWPFSSADVYSANLTWFDAVTAGLNKEEAAKMTVNPLRWIRENYSLVGMTSKQVASTSTEAPVAQAETTPVQNTAALTSFDITVEKTNFIVGQNLTLVIDAKNGAGEKMKEYKPSANLSISSSSSSAEFKKVLNFVNGTTRLLVSNPVAESFSLTIADGSVTKTIYLVSENAPVIEEVVEVTSEEDVNTSEELHASAEESVKQSISQVKFSGDATILKGGSALIYVELFDEDNQKIIQLSDSLDIEVDGEGDVSPSKISSSDISSGKAMVRYSSNQAETATIKIAGNTYEIKVIEQNQIKAATAFRIEEKELTQNQFVEVKIYAVDENGDDTTNYDAFGTVAVTVTEGKAEIEPSTLSTSDFSSGVATIKVKALQDSGRVELHAQNGIYIGEARLKVVESENVFTDVAKTHPNAKAIAYLKDNGIIGGYADGSFQPEKEVSRIEAVKMLILGLNKESGPSKKLNFPDTNNKDWYAPYVGRALYLEMVKGYPDGTFKPSGLVNRAEYYTILIRAVVGTQEDLGEDVFNDVPAGAWFTPYVAWAKEHNITDAVSKFYPSGNVTRAEVAETLYRVLKDQE